MQVAPKTNRVGLRFWLRQMPLRKKLGALTISIVGLMLLSGAANIAVVTYSSHRMQAVLNDNLASYNLQQAVTAEANSFAALARDDTVANRQACADACVLTETRLKEVPYDYEKTGEKRYEVTWTILNSYAQYQAQRDKVVQMNREDTAYIHELYTAYSMQSYLERYCAQLTEIVLQEGNASYSAAASLFIRIPYLLVGISVTALLLLLIVLYSTMGGVFRTLRGLAQASQEIEKNVFTASDLCWESCDEMGQLVHAFNKMKHTNQKYVQAAEETKVIEEQLHRQELERVELEKRFSSAQLQLLKSQLNPHFLFNTLNTIARMARTEGAPVSEQITVAVSNLLRYNLRTTAPVVPLTQELKVVDDYMYIQQMRFGDRVRYRVDCAVNAAETLVPVFLLQPLVENAVLHGISGKENGGSICICVRRRASGLCIAVTDTGAGIDPAQLARVRNAMAKGGTELGIGLSNVCRRIHGFYQDGSVRIHSKMGSGTAVLIEFGRMKQEWIENGTSAGCGG